MTDKYDGMKLHELFGELAPRVERTKGHVRNILRWMDQVDDLCGRLPGELGTAPAKPAHKTAGKKPPPGKGKAQVKRLKNDRPIHDYIFDALLDCFEPLSAREITGRIRAMGYKSARTDLHYEVSAAVRKHLAEKVVKTDAGLFIRRDCLPKASPGATQPQDTGEQQGDGK